MSEIQRNNLQALSSPQNQHKLAINSAQATQKCSFQTVAIPTPQMKSPQYFSPGQSPTSNKFFNFNITQRSSVHQKSNSGFVPQINVSNQSTNQPNLDQLHVQKSHYIAQQSNLYQNAGLRLKQIGSQNHAQSKVHNSSNPINSQNANSFQYDSQNWVFVKNESFNGPLGKTGLNLMAQNLSYKKRVMKMKEINRSHVLSDNTSVDSPTNKSHNSSNIADILKRHDQIRQDQHNSLALDEQNLEDHQSRFAIQDDDSPTQILSKVANSVHDQMCCGANAEKCLSNKEKADSSSSIIVNLQNTQKKKVIRHFSSTKQTSQSFIHNQQDDSNESKNASWYQADQTSNGPSQERVPRVSQAIANKITSLNVQSQNQIAARLSVPKNSSLIDSQAEVPHGTVVVAGSSSNFQSFKKNAMRLPKVALRPSLLNQLNNQKTSSLPISPKVFDNAKFGGSSSNQKKSQNSSQNQNDSSQINPFMLPQIDRTQQSSNYIETSGMFNSGYRIQSGANIPQGLNQNSIFENLPTQYSNNQSKNILQKDIPFRFAGLQSEMSETQIESQLDFQNNQNLNTSCNNQDQASSFMITEAKIENNFKTRFTLANLRTKIVQSPLNQYGATAYINQNNSNPSKGLSNLKHHERLNSAGSHKIEDEQINEFASSFSKNQGTHQLAIVLKKIKRSSISKSNLKTDIQNEQCTSHSMSNQKICSACFQKEKSNLDTSCFSDSQAKEFQQKQPLRLSQEDNCSVKAYDIYSPITTQNLGKKFSLSKSPQQQPEYDVIRDNQFFAQFSKNYTNQLAQLFQNADKIALHNQKKQSKRFLNKSDDMSSYHEDQPKLTMKTDLLAFLEQNTEVRQQIRSNKEAEIEAKKQIKIQRIQINQNQIQSLIDQGALKKSSNIIPVVSKSGSKNLQEKACRSPLAQQSLKLQTLNNQLQEKIQSFDFQERKATKKEQMKAQDFNNLMKKMKGKSGMRKKSHITLSIDEDDCQRDEISTAMDILNSSTAFNQ